MWECGDRKRGSETRRGTHHQWLEEMQLSSLEYQKSKQDMQNKGDKRIKKASQINNTTLPLTLFCRLSGEVTENAFLSVKKTKSVAYCGNFWNRRLVRFVRGAQLGLASVSSCARSLLKHFRCKSLQIIWDTDDRWINLPVSRDISQTCWSAACPLDWGQNH